jgi:hypothetical protein
MTAQPVNTYDRQWEEPEDAWTAFQRYRDLPSPRPSLDGFTVSSGYSPSRLKGWYVRHQWASRLVAWDQRIDQTRQAATLRGVEEMAARHIGLAKLALEAVEKSLVKINKDLDTDFGRMKPHEMARLLEVATKLERLSRGEATERIDGEGNDYSHLTDDDLAALEEISRKIR